MKIRSDLMARLATLHASAGLERSSADRLSDLGEFGINPGHLKARIYLPTPLPDRAPLVVVLHGCTQTAAGYDHGSGWSSLADRHGFALLYPEQQRANNPNGCFNWFEPGDTRRGAGEALSIRQMIEHMLVHHRLDRGRVFVTGLSAGGAMASVMLATYPEIFAGGAIVAGLPFGRAASIPEALERMRGGGTVTERDLGDLVRGASGHRGPWPCVSVWQGSADFTVDSSNAELIVKQWRNVHGLGQAPDRTETVDGHPRRVWCDIDGHPVLEEFRIEGMGHGTPLATRGLETCGASGAFMLDVSISSTHHIARFWGLIDRSRNARVHDEATLIPMLASARLDEGFRSDDRGQDGPQAGRPGRKAPQTPVFEGTGPAKVIEDALRAAGLMR